ncbi:pantoate--beta-alanine ligase [Sphingobacterium sp. DN00404]|uniref:Pantothenate synthetase n=1 Tax=Sphingobacterium micropteri TaxID=2763501 RepID=A0ABR7YSK4_9SPHI|nr:pantoate--beta-alanine ligase [Sphingobacterium micropteri]MBD1434237.1 pantoate--beta-alanine ligase [Sphingobacterium micropteri]
MNIFRTRQALQTYLDGPRKATLRIALIPTMGALHEGHLSLLKEAQQIADIVVCSIFVNPTQFNDPGDLEKYPRPEENDLRLLQEIGCDVAFLPSVEEMYGPAEEPWHLDLGNLEQVWEGEKRPGHFQGVTQIVYKLFRLVEPDIACFGQKDFQQVMVIQRLIELKKLPVRLHIVPTVRNEEGLALSSRNMRLSEVGKRKALVLYRALSHIKRHFKDHDLNILRQEALDILHQEKEIDIEYLAICETRSLQEIDRIDPAKNHVALLVAWVEGVRLIDNMLLD